MWPTGVASKIRAAGRDPWVIRLQQPTVHEGWLLCKRSAAADQPAACGALDLGPSPGRGGGRRGIGTAVPIYPGDAVRDTRVPYPGLRSARGEAMAQRSTAWPPVRFVAGP